MSSSIDEKYMKQCFEIAKNGIGSVSPNPLVGSVIVKGDKILSTGYHEKYGSFHAERNAILNTEQDISGATLYCNLEPCMHTDKQTPPCTQLIISSNIKRVVISTVDPNPKVNGNGIKLLREAGIEVTTNVLEKEGRELNKFFFKNTETGFPYVTLKMAVSRDWKITGEKGKQTWLTGNESKKFVHKQRSMYDAVLVGASTVNIDNPLLTVRDVSGRNPKRIILDGALTANLKSAIFDDSSNGNIVFCLAGADEKRKNAFKDKGVLLIELEPVRDSLFDLSEVLKKIASLKINSLFVEGGGQVYTHFIEKELFDELFVLMAPLYLGVGVDVAPTDKMDDLELLKKTNLGEDILFHYKNKREKCLPD
ncbi:MAG: bifunctional diaminohydroxyphosphoribosylaminopyrimidine deaminase/5-amino-6-(5-phosphoribosylamino)uracil reductase RibD [Ignavibacteria bacterium]|nr:bifunctional diaminohydroxyphosphoribosylaminopyrimidine deaminase/5-amino-6-(5-phosphoribosylamino)uracil reductase RibD [Ignavibacteria bacterium]